MNELSWNQKYAATSPFTIHYVEGNEVDARTAFGVFPNKHW
jgi:hypothetical protein